MTIMGAITCCIECVPPERHPGCHSECERYLKEKEEHDKYNKIVAEGKRADRAGLSEHLLTHTTHKGKRRKKGQP